MLTDKQQKIINDLKTEFTKINTPAPASSGGLINRAAIDKKFEDTRKRKAEIEVINASSRLAISELIDRDIDKLNKDLIPMGMCATTKQGGNQNQTLYIGALDRPSSLYVEYYPKSEYENLPDGSGMYVYKGFEYIKFHDTWRSYTYKSIEDVCKDKDFIKRIEGIYSQILKDKQCK